MPFWIQLQLFRLGLQAKRNLDRNLVRFGSRVRQNQPRYISLTVFPNINFISFCNQRTTIRALLLVMLGRSGRGAARPPAVVSSNSIRLLTPTPAPVSNAPLIIDRSCSASCVLHFPSKSPCFCCAPIVDTSGATNKCDGTVQIDGTLATTLSWRSRWCWCVPHSFNNIHHTRQQKSANETAWLASKGKQSGPPPRFQTSVDGGEPVHSETAASRLILRRFLGSSSSGADKASACCQPVTMQAEPPPRRFSLTAYVYLLMYSVHKPNAFFIKKGC